MRFAVRHPRPRSWTFEIDYSRNAPREASPTALCPEGDYCPFHAALSQLERANVVEEAIVFGSKPSLRKRLTRSMTGIFRPKRWVVGQPQWHPMLEEVHPFVAVENPVELSSRYERRSELSSDSPRSFYGSRVSTVSELEAELPRVELNGDPIRRRHTLHAQQAEPGEPVSPLTRNPHARRSSTSEGVWLPDETTVQPVDRLSQKISLDSRVHDRSPSIDLTLGSPSVPDEASPDLISPIDSILSPCSLTTNTNIPLSPVSGILVPLDAKNHSHIEEPQLMIDCWPKTSVNIGQSVDQYHLHTGGNAPLYNQERKPVATGVEEYVYRLDIPSTFVPLTLLGASGDRVRDSPLMQVALSLNIHSLQNGRPLSHVCCKCILRNALTTTTSEILQQLPNTVRALLPSTDSAALLRYGFGAVQILVDGHSALQVEQVLAFAIFSCSSLVLVHGTKFLAFAPDFFNDLYGVTSSLEPSVDRDAMLTWIREWRSTFLHELEPAGGINRSFSPMDAWRTVAHAMEPYALIFPSLSKSKRLHDLCLILNTGVMDYQGDRVQPTLNMIGQHHSGIRPLGGVALAVCLRLLLIFGRPAVDCSALHSCVTMLEDRLSYFDSGVPLSAPLINDGILGPLKIAHGFEPFTRALAYASKLVKDSTITTLAGLERWLVNAAKDKCRKDLPLYLRFLASLFELCDAATSLSTAILHQRIGSALRSTNMSSRCTSPEGSEALPRRGSLDVQHVAARISLGKESLANPISFSGSPTKQIVSVNLEAADENSEGGRKRKRRQSVSSSQSSEKSQYSIWSPSTVASTPLTANSVGEGLMDKCPICLREFTGERDSRKGNLERHMKSSHGSNERFRCDCCSNSYNRNDNLLQHKRVCYPKKGLDAPKKRVKLCKRS